MEKISAHPSQDDLSAFGLGRLDEGRALAIAQHLRGCHACCDRVENVPADTLVKLLRQAERTALDPRSAGAGDAAASTPDYPRAETRPDAELGSGTPLVAVDVPPGLVDHARYRIVRLLGKGGMGAVYLAEHIVMRQPRALKVISPEFVANPQAVERFHREIQTAARLDHPNIVRAYDAEQSGQTHFLVMEYVEGTDLASLLRKKGPLSVAHACHFIRQAALGLEHAREHGMVHRDIKPHNLMLTRKNLVKILDFGLAKVVSEAATEAGGPTRDGAMMGTPDYMAPEQWDDARTADIRADIYSLGCTLYALLTGTPPFQDAPGPMQKMTAHVQRKPRALTEVRPEVPAELSTLAERMLAKSAADRPQTPGEVAKALQAFLQGAKPPPEPPLPEPPEVPPVPELTPRRRLPVVWLVGAAALLLSGLLAAPLILRMRTSEGTLELTLDPPDATVLVGDKEVTVERPGGGKPVVIRELPGKHKLEITKEGFKAESRDIILVEGENKKLTIHLEPNSMTQGAAPGPGQETAGAVAGADSRGADGASNSSTAATRIRPAPLDCTGRDGVSAEEVKRVQEAWAQYLGRQVEETVPIAYDVTMTFVLIPPGKFWMGAPEAARSDFVKLQEVVVNEPFDLCKYEVTQEQYWALTGMKPSNFKGDKLPVEMVTWEQAVGFSKELTKKREDRHVYRLPTEVEWEYSCRGGRPSSQLFGIGSFGSFSSREANCEGNHPYGRGDKGPYLKATCKVGSYPANALGLCDMHGNVWEWCADRYEGNRVFRGGGYSSAAIDCQAAARQSRGQIGGRGRGNDIGFRLARSIPPDNPTSKPANVAGGDQTSVPIKPEAPVARLRPAPLDCTGPDGVSAEEVKRAQQAWAQYLGRQVEETVPITYGVTMTFVLVPLGKFRMGSPAGEAGRAREETLHTVVLTEPFDLGKYEVTQAQFLALTGDNPSRFTGDDLPVEKVTWEEADEIGKQLTKMRRDRHVYRLPTEAEWEYSCRGGRPSSQPFGIGDGRSLSAREANFGSVKTCKVGSYAANALGLYDMHGNVFEWCADPYGPYPSAEATTNPMGSSDPAQALRRVYRGGGYNRDDKFCRAALRLGDEPGYQYPTLGFRLARSVPSGSR
jgi:formylglycine-generating enzyme required for sulfatase activity/serine/threonine protein kinase